MTMTRGISMKPSQRKVTKHFTHGIDDDLDDFKSQNDLLNSK